jgi:hypothetical protein
MNPLPILSDHLPIRSDEYRQSTHLSAAQTAPQTRAQPASARPGAARFTDRDLQTLRSAELPLRQWAGTRTEAISGDQPAWRTSAQRLRAKCALRAGCGAAGQFAQAARGTQRDLRHQCRTPAPTRGARINRHGPGVGCPRLGQSGCHHRRYGGVLSRRRRSTIRSGAAQWQ